MPQNGGYCKVGEPPIAKRGREVVAEIVITDILVTRLALLYQLSPANGIGMINRGDDAQRATVTKGEERKTYRVPPSSRQDFGDALCYTRFLGDTEYLHPAAPILFLSAAECYWYSVAWLIMRSVIIRNTEFRSGKKVASCLRCMGNNRYNSVIIGVKYD